jgi:hypothetical protein
MTNKPLESFLNHHRTQLNTQYLRAYEEYNSAHSRHSGRIHNNPEGVQASLKELQKDIGKIGKAAVDLVSDPEFDSKLPAQLEKDVKTARKSIMDKIEKTVGAGLNLSGLQYSAGILTGTISGQKGTASIRVESTPKLSITLNAQAAAEVKVVAFTGMPIGMLPVVNETDKTLTVQTARGQTLIFDKVTRVQINASNARFANRLAP